MKILKIFAVILLCGVFAPAPSSAQTFAKDTLTINSGQKSHTFTVELARTFAERERGLMHRKSLASDAGMLFIYERISRKSMWMKNTFIPLDMLFIDKYGKILHIVERTTPHSKEVISSRKRVKSVLELQGGAVSRLGISKGDTVVHTAFEKP